MLNRIKKREILGIVLIIVVILTVVMERIRYDMAWQEGDCLESLCFTIENSMSEQMIRCFQDETQKTGYLFLPSYANAGDVHISFTGAYEAVFINEKEEWVLKSGEDIRSLSYDRPYEVRFVDREGTEIAGQKLVVMHSANLPALFLETDSGSMEMLDADKDYEEKGRIVLLDAGGSLVCADRLSRISGRGNSTWFYPKKSYGIRLKNQADLFGMGSAKNWILLSNVEDKTYLRNKITYEMAIAAGLEGSPESQYIDLYVNNRYHGMYQLCEKVEIDAERIPIKNLGEMNRRLNKGLQEYECFIEQTGIGEKKGTLLVREMSDMTGGYLLERDVPEKYIDEVSGFRTQILDDQYTIKSPKYASAKQVDYISRLVEEMEKAVTAADGINPDNGKSYLDYVDLESYAKKYIVEELCKNQGGGATSSFFYKPEDAVSTKLFAGPVWDYDKAYARLPGIDGSARDLCYLTQRVDSTTLFWHLYSHPEFRQMVSECYEDFFSDYILEINNVKIEEYVTQICASAEMDRIRWREIYGGGTEPIDWAQEAMPIRAFLLDRKAFLDEIWIEQKKLCTVHFIGEEYSRDNYVSVIAGECLQSTPIGEVGSMEAGWILDGWYTADGELFDTSQPICEDITVYSRSHYDS